MAGHPQGGIREIARIGLSALALLASFACGTQAASREAKAQFPARQDELSDLLRGLLACRRQGARRADVGLPELPSGGKLLQVG